MRAKLKNLLKFYYSAEGLNAALDGLISGLARASWQDDRGGEHAFERVCRVLEVKSELSGLWGELDGIISKLSEQDGRSLKRYSTLKGGIAACGERERRELHRALVKFRRHMGNLHERRAEACGLLGELIIFIR